MQYEKSNGSMPTCIYGNKNMKYWRLNSYVPALIELFQ